MNASLDKSAGVFALADRCQVDLRSACGRAGIAISTPYRWQKGTKPRKHQVGRLQRAIVDLARDAGTLPPGVAGTVGLEDLDVRAALDSIEQTVRAIRAKIDAAG